MGSQAGALSGLVPIFPFTLFGASASIIIPTLGYKDVLVVIDDANSNTAGAFLQCVLRAAAADLGANHNWIVQGLDDTAVPVAQNAAAQGVGQFQLLGALGWVQNYSGSIWLRNLVGGGVNHNPEATWEGVYIGTGPKRVLATGGGIYVAGAQVDGIKLKWSAGNFSDLAGTTAGGVRAFGLA